MVVLDRPRHSDIIKQCRAAGARIRLISDGDVGAAIEVAKAGAPVDVLFGIGGTPEGTPSGLADPAHGLEWISMGSLCMTFTLEHLD